MRKVYYFLTLLLTVGFFQSQAQYFPITATGGTQVTGGISVTVTPENGPATGTNCGVGPYKIGTSDSNGYRYDFATPVTHVRFEMVRIHNDDTIQFQVQTSNGGPFNTYTLTGGNLTAFAGTCTATSNNMITPGGLLSTTGGATGAGQAIQVDISVTPALIWGARVTHKRHPNNNVASDVFYSAYLQDDSCSLGFNITVDSPTCSGRDIQLTATNFPNTTYAWTTNAPLAPNFQPSNAVYNPVLRNPNQGQSGQYFLAATRGACTYRDTVTVLVTQSPSVGPVRQTGPVCPNEDDTLFVPLVNLPIGGFVVAYGIWGQDTFDATQGYILEIRDIQPSQANISYLVYAIDIQGCTSDTVDYIMKIKPDVNADFTFALSEGCIFDTVAFINNSITDSAGSVPLNSRWTFGDNSPASSADSPTHYYAVPKPNYTAQSYSVTLIVNNGRCADTVTKPVDINHPVKAYFTIDDDSLCQGGTVTFTAQDSSYVKPGSIPKMLWNYGDGGIDTIFNTTHTYTKAGIYQASFTMTDFLGCVDSFVREIVIDSTGYVSFETDKVNVCVGEEIIFKGEYSTFGYVTAVWNFADGVTIPDSTLVYHSYDKPGTYDVVFAIDYRICDDVSYTGQYTVKPIPQVYIGEDTAICPNGKEIRIGDLYNPGNPSGIKYSWNTVTKDVTPDIIVRHHGVYAVTADLDGCFASDTLVVSKNCYLNIPNAFTPNGDGNGDYFLPRQLLSRELTGFEMHIYNRWGQKVFETTSNNGRGWDGKLGGTDQPTGVYIYTIEASFGNGTTERYQGNVTLIR